MEIIIISSYFSLQKDHLIIFNEYFPIKNIINLCSVLSSLSLLTQRKFRRHSQAPSSSILTTLLWKVKETEGRKNFACGENVVRKSETGRRWKFVMGTSILLREKQCFARGRKSRGYYRVRPSR